MQHKMYNRTYLTDENRAAADLIKKANSILHRILVRSYAEEESEHKETKEEELT